MTKFTQTFLKIAIALVICGCGSITYHARHQYILVKSTPPGADIFYEGRKVGTTPAFIQIRRGRENAIEVMARGDSRRLPIQSKYRWDGSFWANFTFLYFAPIGWSVDWITGGSRAMQDPEPIKLHPKVLPQLRPIRVAISPPKASTADLSDEGGQVWEDQLAAHYPKMQFLKYRDTVPEFASKGYDFDTRPSRFTEYELFARLGVDEVFESEFTETSEGVETGGRFRNVYSNATGQEQKLKAVPWQMKTGEKLPFFERFKGLFHLIPNTLGLEWSTSDTQLQANGEKFNSHPTRDETGWGKVVPYLSALSITRIEPPRRESSGRFRFEFVPTIRLSYRQVYFPTLETIKFNDFSYFNLGLGIGPEVGWQSGPHYVYFNVIPIWGWHRLAWRRDEEVHVSSLGAVTLRAELGYLYFVTDRFSIRLFSKTTTTPPQMWNAAIQDISPGAQQVESGNDISGGLMFSYTFQPRREIHKWAITK